jgi:hypothetical protein
VQVLYERIAVVGRDRFSHLKEGQTNMLPEPIIIIIPGFWL